MSSSLSEPRALTIEEMDSVAGGGFLAAVVLAVAGAIDGYKSGGCQGALVGAALGAAMGRDLPGP